MSTDDSIPQKATSLQKGDGAGTHTPLPKFSSFSGPMTMQDQLQESRQRNRCTTQHRYEMVDGDQIKVED